MQPSQNVFSRSEATFVFLEDVGAILELSNKLCV
jgi:hypothetical protein